MLATVEPVGGLVRRLAPSSTVSFPGRHVGYAVALEARSAVLLGNVARASHGETVKEEILGDGDATAKFQRFSLQKMPLTYVPSADPGGLKSSLRVLVNRVLRQEVPSVR